jgi:ABC-type transport system involved in multi-copper enzyme maturation permease subunit
MSTKSQNVLEPPTIFIRGTFLMKIFLEKMIYDKKTYILILVSFFPLLVTMSLDNASTQTYVDLIQSGSIVSFIVMPLISLILGISAIADEKENKTISQLLARPVYREEIALVKWIATVIVGIVIVFIDALIIYLGLCIQFSDFSIFKVEVFIGVWIYLALWFLVYATIFVFLGIVIDSNALGLGLAIAYFEAFFSQFIFGGGNSNSAFSIVNHINQVASEFLLSDYYSFTILNYEPELSLLTCLALIILFLISSLLVMRRKDFP